MSSLLVLLASCSSKTKEQPKAKMSKVPSRIEAMAEEDVYTKDGTVDYKGNPANKKKTGTWKACPYILGTELNYVNFPLE